MSEEKDCSTCGGSGRVSETKTVRVYKWTDFGKEYEDVEVEENRSCPSCGGSGKER